MAGQVPKRGYIRNEITGDKIEFQYNPETIAVALGNATQTSTTSGANAHRHYTGDIPAQYTFDLWFNSYGDPDPAGTKSVKQRAEQLLKLLVKEDKTVNTDKHAQAGSPPPCTIFFGEQWTKSPGIVTTCSVTYTLFDENYTPVRAKVHMVFQEQPKDKAKQNPTSGGEGGDSSYVAQPGDTLEGIAYREFGDPTLWRYLAAANGIENPRDVRPGQRLVIPTI